MTTERSELAAGAPPQVADALHQLERFNSVLNDQIRQATGGAYVGTDLDKTVEVTVDGARWLTGLHIEDGLLRLGAEVVGDRINEALHSAQTQASAAAREQQMQLFATLTDITSSLIDGLGFDSKR
jgi:DNA-binding protein YbaB